MSAAAPGASRPTLIGMEAVDVLGRIDRAITARVSICFGQRQLDEDAVDRRRRALSAAITREQRGLASCRPGAVLEARRDAGLARTP